MPTRSIIILSVSLFVTGSFLNAISEVTVDDYEARVFTSSKGDTIPYRLFIPRGYDAEKKYLLVLFLHGGGGSGNDNKRQLEGPCPREWAGPERQAKNPCFIVAPQIPRRESRGRTNQPPRTKVMREHIQTIHEILDHLEAEFSIDTSREYVTGLSMGGECTWMAIIEQPNRFAAAVPICAGDKFIGMDANERGEKFAQFPLWIFHGAEDNVISVNISREVVGELKKAGGNPRYTEYPETKHNSWEKAYREPELIEWLFAQSRMKVGHVPVANVLQRLGAKLERGSAAKEIDGYSSHFDRMDTNRDGKHTRAEYVDKGGYMTPQARAGIFRAADGNADGVVTRAEYVLNRIITDEAKAIVQGMDDDKDGLVEQAEFVKHAAKLLSDIELAKQVYAALDANADGGIPIPEYLRVWGQWARAGRRSAEQRIAARRSVERNVRPAPKNCPACAMGLTAEFVFKRLDVNEDKAVTATEFQRSPGMQDKTKAGEAVGRIDKDGNGTLSWEEFETAYKTRHANCKKSDPAAIAANAAEVRPDGRGDGTRFSQVFILRSDQDGDGRIARKEFRGSDLGFDRMDKNGNGFIEPNELNDLHQRRLADPKTMSQRLQDGDVQRPPFGRPGAGAGPPSVDEVFERFDGNKDGKLQKDEVPEFVQQFILSADEDGDNVVTRKELEASRQRQRPTGRPAGGPPRQPSRQGRPQRVSSSPGAHLREFEVSAQDAPRLKYLLQLPRDYSASGDSWPLILFLHGGGERGEILEKVKVHGPPKIAEANPEFPFVVLSPQCPEGLRWTHQIVMLKHLLDEVVEAHNVDRSRIYLTGLSLGGYGTWNMAMTYPGDFAAIAPMCCGGGMIDEVDRLKGMPVWAFHGARDDPRSLTYHENIVAAARRAGADVRFTVHPEAGHDGWTRSYENPELYEWFLSHAKEEALAK